MHTDTLRLCDICTAEIPRGTPYRIGHTTSDAVVDAFADAEPEAHVDGSTTPERLVRIEVCQACPPCPSCPTRRSTRCTDRRILCLDGCGR